MRSREGQTVRWQQAGEDRLCERPAPSASVTAGVVSAEHTGVPGDPTCTYTECQRLTHSGSGVRSAAVLRIGPPGGDVLSVCYFYFTLFCDVNNVSGEKRNP